MRSTVRKVKPRSSTSRSCQSLTPDRSHQRLPPTATVFGDLAHSGPARAGIDIAIHCSLSELGWVVAPVAVIACAGSRARPRRHAGDANHSGDLSDSAGGASRRTTGVVDVIRKHHAAIRPERHADARHGAVASASGGCRACNAATTLMPPLLRAARVPAASSDPTRSRQFRRGLAAGAAVRCGRAVLLLGVVMAQHVVAPLRITSALSRQAADREGRTDSRSPASESGRRFRTWIGTISTFRRSASVCRDR